jgi:transcriptional regulator GlxA family with amidase domain
MFVSSLTRTRLTEYAHVRNVILQAFSAIGAAVTHRIALLVFPRFQILDAAGPLAAFEIAERLAPRSYQVSVVAARPGLVASSCGVALRAEPLPKGAGIDTLIVAGGQGARSELSPATLRFVARTAGRARRVASVCTGAYVLASAGLLARRRATTHWAYTAEFGQRFPDVRLEADRIFVRDGHLWTSAGITAGIDLALALIAEDQGEEAARRTARQLVVYYRRPGGQAQFSALLELERLEGRFVALLDEVRAGLARPLRVTDLASRMGMSPRQFARAFRAETGLTPAKAVERLRVEAARAALESGAPSIDAVARACGFGAADRMRRAFLRAFGSTPLALRQGQRGMEARRSARRRPQRRRDSSRPQKTRPARSSRTFQ